MQRLHDHRRLDSSGATLSGLVTVSHNVHVELAAADGRRVGRAGNADRLPLGHPVQLIGLHRDRSARVAQHQARRGQVVDRPQLIGARDHDVELIGGAVDEKCVAAALSERFEVRQQRRAQADHHRDDDAGGHRAAVELQRIVEHAGVAAHDRVLDPAQQEAPAADLDLGG